MSAVNATAGSERVVERAGALVQVAALTGDPADVALVLVAALAQLAAAQVEPRRALAQSIGALTVMIETFPEVATSPQGAS